MRRPRARSLRSRAATPASDTPRSGSPLGHGGRQLQHADGEHADPHGRGPSRRCRPSGSPPSASPVPPASPWAVGTLPSPGRRPGVLVDEGQQVVHEPVALGRDLPISAERSANFSPIVVRATIATSPAARAPDSADAQPPPGVAACEARASPNASSDMARNRVIRPRRPRAAGGTRSPARGRSPGSEGNSSRPPAAPRSEPAPRARSSSLPRRTEPPQS